MGQRDRGVEDRARQPPGLVLIPRQGAPRLLGRLLLEHLELEELPPFIESASDLMVAAGFRPRPGVAHGWEREGRSIGVTEEVLEDGSRWIATWPTERMDSEAANERVRYLSLASHDLRGALANIRSYAALLLNGRIALEPKVHRGMETILRNADRALSFSQDFFDASRADLNALAFEQEPQALEPLLASAVERQQPAARVAGVVLVLDGHPPLPPVNIDGGRIQHAVEAFVLYQLGRAQAGERILVRAVPGLSGIRIEVQREGKPLSEEEVELVFQREERAFREKKLEDALRIHLALQEVEVHGGRVGVETDTGSTTLFLSLPGTLFQELADPAGLHP
ncbi:HAMP domain-containing sensor histidine kinase [Stigmatella sp. ncwal1]|uniref:histidine kinase n=1 Tax=Stigmatella ashevillensis TaxID=2995309 RepID=A0ABT5D487_9BACT|nr:HAMP domain-containing sensor histidine kinase [Stigmatella ashevillena]MDC0708484.1 HAMP domain-containing sensor histidine kinase [Stigmatella ashevillena]